jgi:3-phenylpropionate/trans-cinnamate dioxygenase ferredoxin reductase subunit
LAYDSLVLATGSRPRRLSVPGADLDGVHLLRRLEDADALRDALSRIRHLTVVGGGWIGLEVAAAARAAGVEVTVLVRGALPLLSVLGPEVAGIYADLHRDHGVDLRTGVEVRRLLGEGTVESVALTDGTRIDTDAVLVGIGASPAAELAAEAGLTVDDGVVVDAQLRSSDPHVYAVGDVANAWHPLLHRRLRVEHWDNARQQPKVAASTILGGSRSYERLPYFYSDQYDLGMEYVGHASPGAYDHVVFRGDPTARRFIAFWMRDARVVAAMNANIWDVNESLRDLIASGRRVDGAMLADPEIPLPTA